MYINGIFLIVELFVFLTLPLGSKNRRVFLPRARDATPDAARDVASEAGGARSSGQRRAPGGGS